MFWENKCAAGWDYGFDEYLKFRVKILFVGYDRGK